MSQTSACVDKESLVTYLYGECGEMEQRRIERHLDACMSCAAEVRTLHDVRVGLERWSPPESVLGFRLADEPAAGPPWWRVPVWAHALAAVLVLMAAAAVSKLEIRYGADGLVVRTGWGAASRSVSATPLAASAAPWRPELVALREQVRREISLARPASTTDRPALGSIAAAENSRGSVNDRELLRRMKALLDESERKQQREFALRLAQLYREMDLQRRSDLLRIEQSFGQIEGQTGAAIAQQREWLNHFVRASQRR